MVLRLVLFDLWGTLFQHEGPGEDHGRTELRIRMVRETLADRGREYATETIDASFARAGEELMAIHADGRDISAEARTVLYMRHLDAELV